MAYTTAQLVTLYTNANLGKAPDAATALTLDAYATQSSTGGISDAVALANTLKLVNSTTAVAVETYQFFTGHAPSVAGLTYLVNSTTNTNDLNDTYYSKFAQENRFINFSINLATGAGEGAAAFALAYKDVTVAQTVATAYDKIIGNAAAAAAGVDVAAAVAYLSRADNVTYLTNFVKANTGLTAAADIDLAVKAALIGEILNAATVSGIGGYAKATTALLTDLSDGTLATDNSAGVNILTAYPSTGLVGSVFNLTVGIDTIVGTNNNDTINGTATAVAASSTVNLLDSIDGGVGVDTLNLANAGAAVDLDPSVLTVKNVEILNLTSVTGLSGAALDVSGWTGLTNANIALAAPAASQAVTAAGTTSVALTASKVGANNLTLEGGNGVSVTTTGGSTGTIGIGATTAPTGAVAVTATSGAYADGANLTLGAITVKGGTTVSVTQSAGITAAQAAAAAIDATNFTVTQAAVTVTGTASTTSVTVVQDAAVTKVNSTGTDGVIGVAAGAVTITDVNNASTTKASTITSVSLTNSGATITSNGINSLTLKSSTATITANTAGFGLSKALTLTLAGGTTNAVTDTNSELTSLTVNATAASSLASFAGAGVTALNVTGAKLLTVTSAAGLTALKTVTVSGAGGLTADVSGLASVTKVDTTASTGVNTINIAGATAAYAGGAGVDSVTLTGALASGGSVTLGAGNDRVLGTTAVTTSVTTVIDGGDGTDAVASSLINAGNASMFKNFEVLNLAETAGIFDVSLLTGSTVTGLELNGGAGGGTYSNVTLAQGTTVTGTSAGTATLSFTGTAGTADTYAVTFNALTTGTATSPTTVNGGTLSIATIENVVVHSNSAGGVNTNTLALTDADARTLVVDGSQAATLTFAGGFGTAGATGLSSIDASAATGKVNLTLTGVGISTTGLTVTTGSGADTITVGNLGATASTSVKTGAGADNVDVSLTLGVIGSGATTAAHTTITDFAAGDKITFVNQGTEVFTSTKVDVSAANDFEAAINLTMTGDGSTNGIIKWFQYGGNTYIVEDNSAGATVAAGDVVVKLTGLIDLSNATGNGTNVITLA